VTVVADESPLDVVGQSIEGRFLATVDAVADEKFADLQDLTNLQGESTGYCKVFTAEKLVKGSMFSIAIPPVGRYFNIHLIPEARYRIPRFVYEGMLTAHGSQSSTDLFPDIDVVMDLENFEAQYRGIAEIYDRAQADNRIQWQPAQQGFLRAFFSPFNLLSFTLPEAELNTMEAYAYAYYSEWLEMYDRGEENTAASAAEITARRARMQVVMRDRDPDIDGVIALYGKEKTRAIQNATLL
jgi:hypothetical protein